MPWGETAGALGSSLREDWNAQTVSAGRVRGRDRVWVGSGVGGVRGGGPGGGVRPVCGGQGGGLGRNRKRAVVYGRVDAGAGADLRCQRRRRQADGAVRLGE